MNLRYIMIVIACMLGLALGADEIDHNHGVAAKNLIGLAEAEEVYHRTDFNRDGVLEYADTIHGGPRPALATVPKDLPAPTGDESKKIDALIARLGDDEFSNRQKAAEELSSFGGKAVPQLQDAIKKTSDAEVSHACKMLVLRISEKLNPAPKSSGWGLYAHADGEVLGLVSRDMANAECPHGVDPSRVAPKDGYLFRVLTGQGKNAVGGRRSYVINNRMTLGYAFIAFPAEYGKSGKRVFVINNNGTIFEHDFGDAKTTEEYVRACTEFDPDPAIWKATE